MNDRGHGRRSPQRFVRGFTMLELTVVLFIMALMSGVVAISIWPAMDDARLRSSASMVIATLRYARSYAVAHHTEATVLFDTGHPSVSVLAPQTDETYMGTATDSGETWSVITTQAGRLRSLPDGITITMTRSETTDLNATAGAATDMTDGATAGDSENQETITFTTLGQAEDVSITLHDAHDKQRVILVDAITGQCELLSDTP